MLFFKNSTFLLILFFCSLHIFAQQEVSILTEIVTDNANILDKSEEELLKNKLTNFETETTTQVVILTVKSLEGNTVEDYAFKVFNENKLGQKDKDNGLLILFSDEDKEVRIEVGRGLESTITDALSSRIIRDLMIPNFKQKQYFKGIKEGTDKIITLLREPNLIDGFLEEKNNYGDNKGLSSDVFGGIVGLFILLIISFFSGSIFKKLKTPLKSLFTGKLGIVIFLFYLIPIVITFVLVIVFTLIPIGIVKFLFQDVINIPVAYLKLIYFFYFLLGSFTLFLLVSSVFVIKEIIKKGDTFSFTSSIFKIDRSIIPKSDIRSPSKGGGYSSNTGYYWRNRSYSSSGSYSSSNSSSSSSSSDDFSGGGGSSGGGGASGSW